MLHKHQVGAPVRCTDKDWGSAITNIVAWVAAVSPQEDELVARWNAVHTYPGEHFDRVHSLETRLSVGWQERLAGVRRESSGGELTGWKCDRDGPVQLVLMARFAPVCLPEAYLENLEAPYREIHALVMACRKDGGFAEFARTQVPEWESSVDELVRMAEFRGVTHKVARAPHHWY